MNTNSNTYTVLYSAGLVILVAAALAFAANALKIPQEKNKEIEKKMNILMSVGKATDAAAIAKDKTAYIEEEYKKYIVEQFVINEKGEKTDGDAFNTDLKAELEKPAAERKLPVFVCNEDGKTLYILPVRGRGLWGPIWGYVSLQSDFTTVSGAIFDHQGETPGLGAEIATAEFQKQFSGKKIYDGDKFTSIEIIKPGSAPVTEHSVDGISGGTITSKGLSNTLFDCLSNYQAFFAASKSKPAVTTEPTETEAQPKNGETTPQ